MNVKVNERSSLELIKLEFIIRLKIKRNDWLLADTSPQAAYHCALFESENVLKFYNLEATRDCFHGIISNKRYFFPSHNCFQDPD